MTDSLNDDFKEKPKNRKRQSSIDFVIPLQLEECIYRIEHLPEEPENADIRFTVWYPDWYDTNTYFGEFQVYLSENGVAVGTALGKMERWEGIATRFTGRFEAEEGVNSKTLRNWLVYWFPVNTVFCCLCMLSALISPEYSLSIVVITLIGYLAVSLMTLSIIGTARQRTRLERITDYLKALIMSDRFADREIIPVEIANNHE